MINRRTLLKSFAAASLSPALTGRLLGQAPASAPAPAGGSVEILRYLESHARPDGGYGWADQEHSHLTPTFAVIGCYRLLKQMPPNATSLAAFVREHHPSALKKLEQERRIFDFQQIQALAWLGAEIPAALRDKIRAWKQPVDYLKQYERHGHPIFQSEISAFSCRALLGLPLNALAPAFTGYLDARRRGNGSFNNTPAAEGGDGHVMNTWWGLQALELLGRTAEKNAETVAWLRSCQLANGGFTWRPKPEFGGVDDVAYTWAAARALRLLSAAPERRDDCVTWVKSLANGDGGFGDRPGWASNPMATWYALGALEALEALDSLAGLRRRAIPPRRALSPDLTVFTIQIEAHGRGSPAEAVDLARSLRIHLWGAKNATPAWLARAQAIADQQNVPVRFFVANEEYGTWVDIPGFGTYSHTSDIVAPAHRDIGEALANRGTFTWPEYRKQRLAPLVKGDGRLIWQFGENEELVRLFLDDSVERGGYAAISTFHFGNPDFTNSEPFLQRWRGQIPYVALQDAHGNEPWWFADMTTGFRTVFLGAEPTWEEWLRALEDNRVAAIRHDAASGFKTWMHAGSREVLEFLRARERDWRWWDNRAIARPLVSIVPVRPGDEFEAGRPERGINLRVRCAWENSTQGLLKQPLAELVKLTVDDREVVPELITKKAPRGALLADRYHQFHLPDPTPGRHRVTALVRTLATGAQSARTVEFTV